jgi:hypothetical protein
VDAPSTLTILVKRVSKHASGAHALPCHVLDDSGHLSGTRFLTPRYAFKHISILSDVSVVRVMCVLRLQGRVCIPHGLAITLMGHVTIPYSTCMTCYLSQKHKQVIRLVVGPWAAVHMSFPSRTITTFTHSLKYLRIEQAKQVGAICCMPPPPPG